jgi:hypothetical protein
MTMRRFRYVRPHRAGVLHNLNLLFFCPSFRTIITPVTGQTLSEVLFQTLCALVPPPRALPLIPPSPSLPYRPSATSAHRLSSQSASSTPFANTIASPYARS